MRRKSFVILLFAYTTVLAQVDSAKRLRFQILPTVFYTPETQWGGGIVSLFYLAAKDTSTTPANMQLYLDGTQMKQFLFQSDLRYFTQGDKWFIRGSHDLRRFPEFYFGLGNNTSARNHHLIDFNLLDITLSGYKKLNSKYSAGPLINYQKMHMLNMPIEQESFVISKDGYSALGLGFGFLADHRDYMLCPENGYYADIRIINYWGSKSLGFNTILADLRHYYTLANNWVVNTNVYSSLNFGRVPFRMMPGIGGPRFLRGYYAGRFRDRNLSLVQTEVRKHLFWRIGLAAFGGMGKVYHRLDEFNIRELKYNYGLGLRFKVDQKSKANIRLDYGRTKDSNGFYIVYAEAF